MKKTIATKQIKLWQRLDRLVIAVPIIVFLYLSMEKYGRQIWEIILKEQNMSVIVGALLLLISATAITALPIVLIWRAISHTVKKSAISNATFRIDEDFDYFREKLTGIPPATISLLMDLKIEAKKDIAALLLRYVKIGAVSMEDGEVRVLAYENLELLPSDRTLLTLIDKRQAQPANLGAWKKQVMTEAVVQTRSNAMAAKDFDNTVAANQELSSVLGKLMVVSEAYPELKANTNFMQLQKELTETENKISMSRQFYNDTVFKYNNAIEMFPASLLAGMFAFHPMSFWEVNETERKNISIKAEDMKF